MHMYAGVCASVDCKKLVMYTFTVDETILIQLCMDI